MAGGVTVKIRTAGRPKGSRPTASSACGRSWEARSTTSSRTPIPRRCYERLRVASWPIPRRLPPAARWRVSSCGGGFVRGPPGHDVRQAGRRPAVVSQARRRPDLQDGVRPGDGIPGRIAGTRANRERLRVDREAGLYDSSDDASWFRERCAALGSERAALLAEPQQPSGMVRRPTGETVADRWFRAPDVQVRKEILIDFAVRVTLFPAKAPVRWVPGFIHGPEQDPTSTL